MNGIAKKEYVRPVVYDVTADADCLKQIDNGSHSAKDAGRWEEDESKNSFWEDAPDTAQW